MHNLCNQGMKEQMEVLPGWEPTPLHALPITPRRQIQAERAYGFELAVFGDNQGNRVTEVEAENRWRKLRTFAEEIVMGAGLDPKALYPNKPGTLPLEEQVLPYALEFVHDDKAEVLWRRLEEYLQDHLRLLEGSAEAFQLGLSAFANETFLRERMKDYPSLVKYLLTDLNNEPCRWKQVLANTLYEKYMCTNVPIGKEAKSNKRQVDKTGVLRPIVHPGSVEGHASAVTQAMRNALYIGGNHIHNLELAKWLVEQARSVYDDETAILFGTANKRKGRDLVRPESKDHLKYLQLVLASNNQKSRAFKELGRKGDWKAAYELAQERWSELYTLFGKADSKRGIGYVLETEGEMSRDSDGGFTVPMRAEKYSRHLNGVVLRIVNSAWVLVSELPAPLYVTDSDR